MAHDVFISYSSIDKLSADALCAALEAAHIRCWLAPRDVIAGMNYSGQITRAVRTSKVMVLIFSEHANLSSAVVAEVELAANSHVHILNFRVDASPLGDDLLFYLQHRHWLDAMTPPMARHHARLVESIRALLNLTPATEQTKASAPAAPIVTPVAPASVAETVFPPPRAALWKRLLLFVGLAIGLAWLVGGVTDDTTLSLFIISLATFCLGCVNAVRERIGGNPASVPAYLLRKLLSIGSLTAAQGAFFYIGLWAVRWYLYPLDPYNPFGIERGISGSPLWQIGSVLLTAYSSTSLGLAISALSRSEMQAVIIVPLVLIPQLLFSGLVMETRDMTSQFIYGLTSIMPGYAAETMMDVGAFWDRRIIGGMYDNRKKAGDHLEDLRFRELTNNPPEPGLSRGELRSRAASEFRTQMIHNAAGPGVFAVLTLLAWMMLGYVAAWLGLRAKRRR